MLRIPVGSFDFAVYYDCQEEAPVDELFYDCREPPELRHPISDTGDICPHNKNHTLRSRVASNEDNAHSSHAE